MARTSVQIDSGPITATDPLRYVPKERWRDLMLARRYFAEVNVSYDCRCLVQFVEDAKQMYKPLGFASIEDMIRDGYGLEPEEVAIAVRWLELNPPDEPLALEAAVKLGRHGGDRRSEKVRDQVRDTKLKPSTDTKAYVLARLDRDDPRLAAEVRSGKKSANKAAIEAGFRKRPTPFEQVTKLIPQLTATERRKLIELLKKA